ncbi:hypothetical protein V8F33_005881 [Rhypophila sp. PSN 637]
MPNSQTPQVPATNGEHTPTKIVTVKSPFWDRGSNIRFTPINKPGEALFPSQAVPVNPDDSPLPKKKVKVAYSAVMSAFCDDPEFGVPPKPFGVRKMDTRHLPHRTWKTGPDARTPSKKHDEKGSSNDGDQGGSGGKKDLKRNQPDDEDNDDAEEPASKKTRRDDTPDFSQPLPIRTKGPMSKRPNNRSGAKTMTLPIRSRSTTPVRAEPRAGEGGPATRTRSRSRLGNRRNSVDGQN